MVRGAQENKRMLELFAGTGSVGDVFRSRGWEVVSLDRDMRADIQTDIMDWDYRQFPPGHFAFIWASPPCTEYSRAKTKGVRRIEEANAVTQRTLEIIDYLSPAHYAIENPQAGYLKNQPFMSHAGPFNDVDYCKYSFPYRKRTRLWNNVSQCRPASVPQRLHVYEWNATQAHCSTRATCVCRELRRRRALRPHATLQDTF